MDLLDFCVAAVLAILAALIVEKLRERTLGRVTINVKVQDLTIHISGNSYDHERETLP